jgi:hypothetical protein
MPDTESPSGHAFGAEVSHLPGRRVDCGVDSRNECVRGIAQFSSVQIVVVFPARLDTPADIVERKAWEKVPKAGAYAGKMHRIRRRFVVLTLLRMRAMLVPTEPFGNAAQSSARDSAVPIAASEKISLRHAG